MTSFERDLSAWNEGYLVELYERYRREPGSVDRETRSFFESRDGGVAGIAADTIASAVRLAAAIRRYGHRCARVDPVGGPPPGDESLDLAFHSLEETDLLRLPASIFRGPLAESAGNASEAIALLRRVYCSTRGYDYGHIHAPEERNWLAEAAESGRFRPPQDPIDGIRILESLTDVESFEQFLQRMLPGKFRFSLEGLDMLVPLLNGILGEAAEAGVRSAILGMAHRGRLNVLVHVLKKPYRRVMADLRDPETQSGRLGDEPGFRGDVSYHMGAKRRSAVDESVELVVTMPPNPSHVEAIDPIVVGMARAAGTATDRGGPPRLQPGATLPLLVHGDAAFPGQGVVAETLNLGQLPAYTAGGTIHVIANNGLGFTTDPEELYGTHYASDLAKGFDVPILHVNADDPEAVVEAARTAVAFLERFRKDFVVDLVGYRRRGHNEADEPSFTQPLRYRRIAEEPTVRQKWARTLVERGALKEEDVESLWESSMGRLREEWNASKQEEAAEPSDRPSSGGSAPPPSAAVSLERLREWNEALLDLPEGFEMHAKLDAVRKKRRDVLREPDEKTIDWATAEELAFASILADGIAVRLTGEDVERGTFSQRHAVLHDVETGEEHVPLQGFPAARAPFEVANSPLTENAALGFEVGYNFQAPERLVLWEAQYGDFINGAQVVVDEFLVSARAKWGLEPSLVLLLPHGHEGHGPDHSSARLERFLSLAADENLRVANVTTASQYFHLLRRHAGLLGRQRRPLVLFTPKGLLRHPLARSTPRELAEGSFAPVLDDPRGDLERHRVHRLVLSSGRISVDLKARGDGSEVALARLEQLYPFPEREVQSLLGRYPRLDEVLWVQEEPRNMGAWSFLHPRLADLLPESVALGYVGRETSSSPAEGSFHRHERRQEEIVSQALTGEVPAVIPRVPAGKEV